MTLLDVLAGLARANLAAAAAVGVVALLRKPARRTFGARAAYLLWFAPVLAGAAALVPPASSPALPAPAMVLDAVVVAGGAVEATVTRTPVLPSVALGLWIAGALVAAALLLWRQASFMAAIARREAGPAVVGAIRPRIVTPADFEARFAADEREVILAHEGAHLAAGDARINALAAAASCLCWFNPLVHLGVRLMRLDQELACDAAVLGRFPKARRLYAEVLLKTQLAAQPLPFGCHWPAAAEHPLKERIVMLKSPLPAPARRWAGVACVSVLSAAAAAAAWAAQPGQPKLAPVVARAVAAAAPAPVEAPPIPAAAATGIRKDAAAVAETPNTLTQAEARAQAGPDDEVLCKPGTDWTQKNCRISHGKTWARVATASDVAEAYPAAAKAAGLTARVLLQCAPNLATHALDGCQAVRVTPIDGPAPPATLNGAFEQAAIRVAGKYRLASPIPADLGLGKRFFMTVDFSDHPVLAGGPPAPPVTGPGPHGPALTVMPDWVARPVAADITRFYPPAAKAAKLEGNATITCRVDGDGRLGQCQLLREAPEGAGFGDMALKLADTFQMKPLDKEGRATAGQDVRIPFKFALPSGDPAPTKVSDAHSAGAGATADRLRLARMMGVQVSERPDTWPPR